MSVQQPASPAEIIGVGLTFAAAGVYFILAGMDVVPMPSATSSPPFIVVCAGLAFLFAGLLAIIRARAGAPGPESGLPHDAPRWTEVSYRAAAIAAAGSLALIGTWVAIGAGPRAFTIAGTVELRTTGEMIGRSVFALGATIAWIYVFALAVGTVRKLLSRSG
jgi:hypothetical protein